MNKRFRRLLVILGRILVVVALASLILFFCVLVYSILGHSSSSMLAWLGPLSVILTIGLFCTGGLLLYHLERPKQRRIKFCSNCGQNVQHSLSDRCMRCMVKVDGRGPHLKTKFCWSCGYDLRGSPSERCPECGSKR